MDMEPLLVDTIVVRVHLDWILEENCPGFLTLSLNQNIILLVLPLRVRLSLISHESRIHLNRVPPMVPSKVLLQNLSQWELPAKQDQALIEDLCKNIPCHLQSIILCLIPVVRIVLPMHQVYHHSRSSLGLQDDPQMNMDPVDIPLVLDRNNNTLARPLLHPLAIHLQQLVPLLVRRLNILLPLNVLEGYNLLWIRCRRRLLVDPLAAAVVPRQSTKRLPRSLVRTLMISSPGL